MGKFDEFYSACKEKLEEAKKPFVKKGIMRQLHAAYDDASQKIIDSEKSVLDTITTNFTNYDINKVIKAKYDIEKLQKQQAIIKDHYKELFDEDMKVE